MAALGSAFTGCACTSARCVSGCFSGSDREEGGDGERDVKEEEQGEEEAHYGNGRDEMQFVCFAFSSTNIWNIERLMDSSKPRYSNSNIRRKVQQNIKGSEYGKRKINRSKENFIRCMHVLM